jgi:hypothetical protein
LLTRVIIRVREEKRNERQACALRDKPPAAACRVHRTNAKSSRSNTATQESVLYSIEAVRWRLFDSTVGITRGCRRVWQGVGG